MRARGAISGHKNDRPDASDRAQPGNSARGAFRRHDVERPGRPADLENESQGGRLALRQQSGHSVQPAQRTRVDLQGSSTRPRRI